METASHLLQRLGEVMQTARRTMRSNKKEDRFLLSQDFIEAMTRVTSNLIEAYSMIIDRYTHMPQYQRINSPKHFPFISC